MIVTPETFARVKDIFLAACEKPSAEREAFLAKTCAGDTALRAEIDRLLRHHVPQNPNQLRSRPEGRGLITAVAEGAILAAEMNDTPVFAAGHVVAERYRIVARIGEGAMGRVYRADDLLLNQPVALKFLASDRCRDPAWRRRFEAEVRLARQISHPNICRVHDMGETKGTYFISMEYVDGEDLASLLRRVGRLTGDRAVEIARQMCVGIASAHIHGILHRDLKPANVMIDARGCVRITDFGLAAPAGQVPHSEVRSGTPRYMAPEQITGEEVTERSDIYSLGLILYEMFTGEPAFDGRSLAEYVEQHRSVLPPAPSSIVPDIHSGIDALIMRCIAKAPSARPESVLAVAAALPGNDLLSAALATGQIPSPSMVASAATGARIPGRAMRRFLVACLILIGAAFFVGRGAHPITRSSGAKPPEVLKDRGRSVAALAGYARAGSIRAGRYHSVEDVLTAARSMYLDDEWGFPVTGPAGLLYVYREDADGSADAAELSLPFIASAETPMEIMGASRGLATLIFGADGRLLLIEALPSVEESESGAAAANLAALVEATGFDLSAMRSVPPRLLRGAIADELHAFSGTNGEGTGDSVRIEAALFNGRVTRYVASRDNEMPLSTWQSDPARRRVRAMTSRNIMFLLLLAAALGSAFSRQGASGDVRGAVRLASVILVLRCGANLLSTEHVLGFSREPTIIGRSVLAALCEALVIGVLYLALESRVRRIWPQTLVGWSRILIRKVRDPFVGRDILIGTTMGAAWAILGLLDRQLPNFLGWQEREPLRAFSAMDLLLGSRFAAATALEVLQVSIYQGLMLLIMLVLARRVVLREGFAVLIVCLVTMPLYVTGGCHPLTAWLFIGAGVIAVAVLAMVRFGLLAVITGLFVAHLLNSFPLTGDVQQWYAGYGFFAVTATIALASFGYAQARSTGRTA